VHHNSGDFLGRCEISSQDLLHPTTSVLTVPLEPKPGLSEKKLKLVGGTISVQPSPLPFGRGRATPPLKLPNGIKKKKKGKGNSKGDKDGNKNEGDDDDDDDDEEEVEVVLDPTAERARLEQEGKPLPPLPEDEEESDENADLVLNTANDLLKAPTEEQEDGRGHEREGKATNSKTNSKTGTPSAVAFKGLSEDKSAAAPAPSLDAASLSSSSTNAQKQNPTAPSSAPAPPLSRSVTELGAGQLMDALLRGTKGTSRFCSSIASLGSFNI